MTRVAARGADRSTAPNSLETRARPVVPLSGSGSNTINVGGGGRGGCAMRLGPHPAARTTAIVTRSADGRRARHAWHFVRSLTTARRGPRRSSPRTPTIAAGVSRRMESGASFAMRPETYTATPRTKLSTIPKPAFAGRVHVALEAHLAVRTEREPRVILQRDADGSIGAGAECVGREDRLSRPGRNRRVLAHDERGARRRLDVSSGRGLLGQHRRRRRKNHREDTARPSRPNIGPPGDKPCAAARSREMTDSDTARTKVASPTLVPTWFCSKNGRRGVGVHGPCPA